MLISCEKKDYGTEFAGTYFGLYTTPTDTFTSNLYVTTTDQKNLVNITALTDSGTTSITVKKVIIDEHSDDKYGFLGIDTDNDYAATGEYYHYEKVINFKCTHGQGATTWICDFEGTKQ